MKYLTFQFWCTIGHECLLNLSIKKLELLYGWTDRHESWNIYLNLKAEAFRIWEKNQIFVPCENHRPTPRQGNLFLYFYRYKQINCERNSCKFCIANIFIVISTTFCCTFNDYYLQLELHCRNLASSSIGFDVLPLPHIAVNFTKFNLWLCRSTKIL